MTNQIKQTNQINTPSITHEGSFVVFVNLAFACVCGFVLAIVAGLLFIHHYKSNL